MPPARPSSENPRSESGADALSRANLRDFQQKSILYGLATVAGVAFWVGFRRVIPLKLAVVGVGAVAVEAGRNIKRWMEWNRENPRANRVHPDRIATMQQETVRILADAAKARAWFTRGLIVCIAIPSILELFVGLDRSVALASVDPVAVRSGEWWRLLGGTYLHGSLYHFTGNMGALLVYGSILESKTSRVRLPFVYLLSALGGAIASVLIPPDAPSIGASGGIVGIIGYLFVFSQRQAVKFPPAFHAAMASVFVGLITAGALGYWYIDNPGHAGGALTGILLAGLIVDTARNYGEEVSLPLLDLLGWIATAILIAGAAITSLALLGR